MKLIPIAVGELETNCYLFSADNKHCCIIDPGAEGVLIAQAVYDADLIPTSILFTHGHLDNLLGAAELTASLSRHGYSCRLYIHTSESEFTGPGCLKVHSRLLTAIDPHMLPMYSSVISMIPKAENALEDGEVIPGTGLQVIHTPGHSTGSVCLYHEEFCLCFTGDTLFQGSVGRTDLPGGDMSRLQESLGRLISLVPDEAQLYPGHGPSSVMGQEKNTNPYLR